MNAVIYSQSVSPLSRARTRREHTLRQTRGWASRIIGIGLAAALAALPVAAGSPSSAYAGDTDKAKEIGKTTLGILGIASKTAGKASQAIQILDMVKTAKNPCGCSKKVISAIYRPFKNGNYDSKGVEYAEAIAKCFGFRGLPSNQTQELIKAVQTLWTRMAKNRTNSILFLRRIEQERRKECKKKKTVNQTAFYDDSDARENNETLLAGLGEYTLPGSEPLAAGDLDGDGLTDLAVADSDSDTIALLLAVPSDGFEVSQTLSAGVQPAFVFIDDVDLDGFFDILVLNRGSADGSLFLGNGDGTVGDEVIFDAVRGGQTTMKTDIDGDGTPETVSVNEVPGHVSVARSALDGLYDSFLDYPAGETADAVLPLDVDFDGVIDLLIHNQGASAVAVLPGNGDGSFQEPMVFTYDETGNLVETSGENGSTDDTSDDVTVTLDPGTLRFPNKGTIGTPRVSITPLNTNGVTFVPAPSLVEPAPVISRGAPVVPYTPSLVLGQ